MKKITFIILCVFIFILTNSLYSFQAKVISMVNGDTIAVLSNEKKIKIRFYGIDCPEKKQCYGLEAKTFVSNMVFGKMVEVKGFNKSWDRLVALIYIKDVCLNEELIKNGFAWVYPKYCKKSFRKKWEKLQKEAKRKKLGL